MIRMLRLRIARPPRYLHVARTMCGVIFAPLASLMGQAPRGIATEVHDTLRLHYVGYPVGHERYDLVRDGSGYALSADFSYVDRGRRTHTKGEMHTAADYAPEQLVITRLTDTSSTVDTRVDVKGRSATVFARRQTVQVALPGLAFAIDAHAPVSQHLLLIRYWLAHGRPHTLAVVPGGPTNEATIEWRGRDTLELDGNPTVAPADNSSAEPAGKGGMRRVVLDRYSVDGVAWGGETVWIDSAGRLGGIATRAGNLTFEAVRVELESQFSRMMSIAARDRVADLVRLGRNVTPVASGTVALTGARLIDGTGRGAIANATVVVANGRIVAAGPTGSVTIPSGAKRVDVAGKTIAPGLWDMHTHLMQVEWAPVYLAAGVTTVRDMGNELELIVPFRAAVDSGKALGPRMLLAGLVDGGGPNAFGAINAATPDEGRAVVRRYHELGFEQMKLYDQLRPDVVGAITREAHQLGMSVTGHVPRALGLLAAIDSGQDHIAHLAIRGDAGSDSVRRVIAFLKAHGTVMDPTASWGELLGHSTQEPVSALVPGVDRLAPVLRQRIAAMGSTTVDSATAHARMARTLAIIRELHEAGVPVVPGTDEGVPGFSVYREVELYAAAGFTPAEALRAASAVSAKAMRLDSDVGTLEPGKRADLIVLDSNPLDDLRNLNTIRMVMKAGVLYNSDDIWRAIGFRAR